MASDIGNFCALSVSDSGATVCMIFPVLVTDIHTGTHHLILKVAADIAVHLLPHKEGQRNTKHHVLVSFLRSSLPFCCLFTLP